MSKKKGKHIIVRFPYLMEYLFECVRDDKVNKRILEGLKKQKNFKNYITDFLVLKKIGKYDDKQEIKNYLEENRKHIYNMSNEKLKIKVSLIDMNKFKNVHNNAKFPRLLEKITKNIDELYALKDKKQNSSKMFSVKTKLNENYGKLADVLYERNNIRKKVTKISDNKDLYKGEKHILIRRIKNDTVSYNMSNLNESVKNDMYAEIFNELNSYNGKLLDSIKARVTMMTENLRKKKNKVTSKTLLEIYDLLRHLKTYQNGKG